MGGYDITWWCPLCGAAGNVHGNDKDEAVQELEKVEEEHEYRKRSFREELFSDSRGITVALPLGSLRTGV
jgi:hypothetical protein